jgi:hypothetical protein
VGNRDSQIVVGGLSHMLISHVTIPIRKAVWSYLRNGKYALARCYALYAR